MKNIKLKLLLLILVNILFISCDQEFEEIDKNQKDNSMSLRKSNENILGKKLENPYSVKNMKIAFENLKKNGLANGTKDNIKATHLYVKFKPINEDELDLIKIDSSLHLYEHPLDYELNDDFENYYDPLVPIDQPTYQYCSVKVGYSFPSVDYEILENLFIPEEIKIKNSSLVYSIDDLVDEALRITHNLEEDPKNNKNILKRRSKWRPAGRIQVWDENANQTITTRVFSHWEYYDCDEDDNNEDYSNDNQYYRLPDPEECRRAIYRDEISTTNGGFIPMEGVRVEARRWFRTVYGVTNSQGYYSCEGMFRRKARYKIYWKRYDYVIRVGLFDRARKRGPRKRGNWNWNIEDGRQKYYATIFRACHHYYHKEIKGLRRPPQNSFFHTKLKIRARYTTNGNTNGSHCAMCRFAGMFSRINIYNPGRGTKNIYATTIHELAHASHWKMDSWHYNRMNYCDDTPLGVMCSGHPVVAESWARGVQWELTRMVYPNYQPNYFGDYSGIVQDLIDNDNSYNDNVTGYTIRQIEDALDDQLTWGDWNNSIKNSYNNGTENNLESLFNHWY